MLTYLAPSMHREYQFQYEYTQTQCKGAPDISSLFGYDISEMFFY